MQGKERCKDSKQIPEDKLYEAINNHFGWSKFNEKQFDKKVDYLVAKQNNQIELHMKDESIEVITWVDPTRANSWTPEMKAKAKERAKLNVRKKGADGRWLKSE